MLWFYRARDIHRLIKTPRESSKVTPVAQESLDNTGVTPEHMRNYAPAPSKVTTHASKWFCEECKAWFRQGESHGVPVPTKSNLILDIIWTWLIKNGVEVSEEAKDELERKVKGVL